MTPPAPEIELGRAICRRLAIRRRTARLPVKRLAAEIGISPSALEKWECGDRNPTLNHAILWARALGAEIEMTGA